MKTCNRDTQIPLFRGGSRVRSTAAQEKNLYSFAEITPRVYSTNSDLNTTTFFLQMRKLLMWKYLRIYKTSWKPTFNFLS